MPVEPNAIPYNSLAWRLTCIPLYYIVTVYICICQLAVTASLAPRTVGLCFVQYVCTHFYTFLATS